MINKVSISSTQFYVNLAVLINLLIASHLTLSLIQWIDALVPMTVRCASLYSIAQDQRRVLLPRLFVVWRIRRL